MNKVYGAITIAIVLTFLCILPFVFATHDPLPHLERAGREQALDAAADEVLIAELTSPSYRWVYTDSISAESVTQNRIRDIFRCVEPCDLPLHYTKGDNVNFSPLYTASLSTNDTLYGAIGDIHRGETLWRNGQPFTPTIYASGDGWLKFLHIAPNTEVITVSHTETRFGFYTVHRAPTFVEGNPKCSDLVPGTLELKVEPVVSGTYSDSNLQVDVVVEDGPDGETFNFSSSLRMTAVFAKGGNNGNLYSYDDPGVFSSMLLNAPVNPNNEQFFDLSHISFCYTLGESGVTPTPVPPTPTPPTIVTVDPTLTPTPVLPTATSTLVPPTATPTSPIVTPSPTQTPVVTPDPTATSTQLPIDPTATATVAPTVEATVTVVPTATAVEQTCEENPNQRKCATGLTPMPEPELKHRVFIPIASNRSKTGQ